MVSGVISQLTPLKWENPTPRWLPRSNCSTIHQGLQRGGGASLATIRVSRLLALNSAPLVVFFGRPGLTSRMLLCDLLVAQRLQSPTLLVIQVVVVLSVPQRSSRYVYSEYH